MGDYDPRWGNAISSIESGGNYGQVTPSPGGRAAYGKYQVMGENIPDWTQAALGKSMTPQEFTASPDAQDAVFKHRFGGYVDQYGSPQDAASAWFTGRPINDSSAAASDKFGTTGASYVAKFNKAMGETDGPTAIQNAMGLQRNTGSAMGFAPDDTTRGALSPQQDIGALSPNYGAAVAAPQQAAQDQPSMIHRIGMALMNAAPGLASISSPAQAQALQIAANAMKPAATTWSTNFDPITGMATQTSADGKGTRQFKYAEPRSDPNDKVQWGITGKDKYGQPIYGDIAKAAAAQASNPTPAAADAEDAVTLTGQPFIDQLGKDKGTGYQSQVQSILDGRTPYPTGMLLKTPFGQQLAQDVTQADPTYEAGNPTARVKTRNEFFTGGVASPAGQITAGNTALQHAGEMSDALEKFKGDGVDSAGIPFASYYYNKAHNAAVQGTTAGVPLNDFMTAKNHFSEEVTKFYAGSAGSEGERKRALANLDEAKSLPELRSAIKEETDLMAGKVNALQDRWHTGMGPMAKDFPLIQPKSQAAIARISQRNSGVAPPAAPSTPMKTSNGVTWSIN